MVQSSVEGVRDGSDGAVGSGTGCRRAGGGGGVRGNGSDLDGPYVGDRGVNSSTGRSFVWAGLGDVW